VAVDPVLMGAGSGAASGAAMGAMLAPGTMGLSIPAGMIIGGAMGALGGMGQKSADKSAADALKAQQEAIAKEMKARAAGIGAARSTFGDINSYGQSFNGGSGFAKMRDPSKYQDIGKTLQNRSVIQGGIDQQAGAVRDAGRMGITGAAQAAGANTRAVGASRGLMGSSIDQGARQNLLGSYAGARADLAGHVQATKQGGWDAIRGQQNAFEGAAAGGSRIQGQLGSLSALGTISGARAQQPMAAMGNMLNMGLGTLNQGMLAEAQGGQGMQALGMPSMGLAGSGIGGATISKPATRRLP